VSETESNSGKKKMDVIKRVSLRKVDCLHRLSNVIQCSIEFDCFHNYDDLKFDGRNTFVQSVARARFVFQSDYPIRKKYSFLLYSLSVGLNTRTRLIGSAELQ